MKKKFAISICAFLFAAITAISTPLAVYAEDGRVVSQGEEEYNLPKISYILNNPSTTTMERYEYFLEHPEEHDGYKINVFECENGHIEAEIGDLNPENLAISSIGTPMEALIIKFVPDPGYEVDQFYIKGVNEDDAEESMANILGYIDTRSVYNPTPLHICDILRDGTYVFEMSLPLNSVFLWGTFKEAGTDGQYKEGDNSTQLDISKVTSQPIEDVVNNIPVQEPYEIRRNGYTGYKRDKNSIFSLPTKGVIEVDNAVGRTPGNISYIIDNPRGENKYHIHVYESEHGVVSAVLGDQTLKNVGVYENGDLMCGLLVAATPDEGYEVDQIYIKASNYDDPDRVFKVITSDDEAFDSDKITGSSDFVVYDPTPSHLCDILEDGSYVYETALPANDVFIYATFKKTDTEGELDEEDRSTHFDDAEKPYGATWNGYTGYERGNTDLFSNIEKQNLENYPCSKLFDIVDVLIPLIISVTVVGTSGTFFLILLFRKKKKIGGVWSEYRIPGTVVLGKKRIKNMEEWYVPEIARTSETRIDLVTKLKACELATYFPKDTRITLLTAEGSVTVEDEETMLKELFKIEVPVTVCFDSTSKNIHYSVDIE